MINFEEIIKYSQKLKLLYVEDNQEARESTIMILEEFFDDITIAINGEDGYEKFKEDGAFDLIITDINMPVLNGLDMIAKIREIDKNISILVLSAYNESGFFMDSIKLGVEGYLLKPIDMNQFIGVLQKVIEKLKLKDEADENLHFLKEYQDATNSSSIVSKTDTEGVITYVNDIFCEISGYSREELIGKNHNMVRHPDMPKEVFADLWDTIKNKKQIWKGIVRNLSKSGKSYYVKSTIKPILDRDNNIVEYIGIRDDITDIMNPKKQLNDAIKNAKEPLVVYLKLDEFRTLEEFYDNATVEKIQDKITKYLEENMPSSCPFEKVYQLGNGEYAMIQEKNICINDKDDFIENLKEYQNNINNGTVDISDVDYDMSVIISLAYNDNQVLESSKLGIRKLLKTKQDFIIANNFAQKEKEKAQKNMKILSIVKKAIDDFKIVSYFQPIINNKTQEIEKYESLVRLIDENGKVLSPFFFLDTAKKGKYYLQITNMVLDNSFAALKNTNMDISMNLSALDIENENIREKLISMVSNCDNANRIVFELLEDEQVKDFQTVKDFISHIKTFGCKIAIDDFGAGHSNFERLLDYQPDILKIDGCLIRDIETNSYSLSVVKTIVTFAKEQNIQTVAEFIENEAIFNILRDLGVTYSQGYYFGKPEPLNY